MKGSLSFYTFIFLASMLLMRGSGVLAKILLARSITPYEYGIITLIVISLPGTFQSFTNFCFYDVLSHGIEGRKYFGFSMIYGALSTVIVAAIILTFPEKILNFLNLPIDSLPLLLMVFFIVLFSVTITGNILGVLRGLKRYSLAIIVSLAPSVLRLGFIIIAVYLLYISDFNLILIIFALPPLIILLLILIVKNRTILSSLQSISIPTKDILLFGFSVHMVNAWGSLSQYLNQIVISHDLGVLWQGYFDVSLSVAAIISFLSAALYFISIPELTGGKNRGELFSMRGGLGDLSKALFSMSILFALVLYFYSTQIIELLFSPSYVAAGDYLIIIAIGYIFLFIQQFIAYSNISLEKTSTSFILITIFSLVLYPFFIHLLIQYFNFLGAYISFTLFVTAYTSITIFFSKDLTGVALLLHRIDRLIISALVVFLFLYFFKPSLISGIILSILIYSFLIFSLGYLDKVLLLDLVSKKL
jgi:O-antigen/teichoic acid export membrane protein